jgi:hypothetical protein
MGVSFLDDLYLVLRLPKKTIRFRQFVARRRRNEFVPRKLSESDQRAGSSQRWFIAAVDELECLGEEFDLANAAIAELDVAFFAISR